MELSKEHQNYVITFETAVQRLVMNMADIHRSARMDVVRYITEWLLRRPQYFTSHTPMHLARAVTRTRAIDYIRQQARQSAERTWDDIEQRFVGNVALDEMMIQISSQAPKATMIKMIQILHLLILITHHPMTMMKAAVFVAPGRIELVDKPNSIALRIAMVADDRADLVATLRWGYEWDIAAATLIAREAGAEVTDAFGAPLAYNKHDPRAFGLLVCSPHIHAAAVTRLAERAARLSQDKA